MTGKVCAGFLIALIFLTGCASRTPVLLPTDYCRQDSGYIYGRFNLKTIPKSCGLDVGLVMLNRKSPADDEYMILFTRTDDVVGIAVKPGEYAIGGIAFLTEAGTVHNRKPLEKRKGGFRVEKGKAYYVGEFMADTACVSASGQGGNYSWGMREVDSDFSGTTEAFSQKYVHFNDCEKISTVGKGKRVEPSSR